MKTLISAFLLTTLFFSLPATSQAVAVQLTEAEQSFLQAHPTIVLGTEAAWEPFVIVNPDGTITGYDADILERINALTGANFQLEAGSWSDMQQRARSRDIDGLSTGAPHEERKSYLNFSDIYFSVRKTVLVARGNPENFRSLNDLQGRAIAVHKDNLADEKLARQIPGAVIHQTATIQETIESVLNGQADATFSNGTTLYFAQKSGLPYLQIAFPLDETLRVVFGVRNDWPEAVSILNKGLAAIPARERLEIQNKWLPSSPIELANLDTLPLTHEERDYLASRGPITLCTDPDWAPYISIDARGEIQGVFAELQRMIARKIGKETRVVRAQSWAEALDFARARKCDVVLAIADTPERRDYLNFSSTLLTVPKVIATKIDKLFIDKLESLNGETLAVVEGYATLDYVEANHPEIRIRRVGSPHEGMRLVHEGEVFGYVDSVLNIADIIQKQQYFDLKISGQLDASQDYVLGVGVRNDDPLLLSIYDKAIATITEQDRQKLLDQVVMVRYDLGFDDVLFRKAVAGIAAVVLGGGLLLYVLMVRRQRTELNIQVAQRTAELVEKNRAIEQMIAELEQKNSELERFAYTVSHDLKSPLVTINCFADLLEIDLGSNASEQVRSYLAFIRSAGDKMHNLLNDLLELSRAGRTVNLVDKVSLAGVAAEAVELLRGQIDACTADIRISDGLPLVKGDAKRLCEMMQNLIENAIKYAVAQTRPLIEIGAAESPNGWACYVKDNGRGIPTAYHEKVFGLFERLHSDQEGTGIGLALVKRIIELHGGKVWIESAGENQGTTVWFTLPLAD